MTITNADGFAGRWKDIASTFLKLGVMSDGGPAIMGIMQAELQEKRTWIPKDRSEIKIWAGAHLPRRTR